MGKRVLFLIVIPLLILAGCRMRKPAGQPVVSQISVIYETDTETARSIYTGQEKMQQILNCLRNLGQQFTPFADPDTLSGPQYSIRILSTDGTQRIYQIKSDRYIRIDGAPWRQTDPERITKLSRLLQTLSPDAVQNGHIRNYRLHFPIA